MKLTKYDRHTIVPVARALISVKRAERAVIAAAIFFEKHPHEHKRFGRHERAVARLLTARAKFNAASRVTQD